jgi:hypothetical protein
MLVSVKATDVAMGQVGQIFAEVTALFFSLEVAGAAARILSVRPAAGMRASLWPWRVQNVRR